MCSSDLLNSSRVTHSKRKSGNCIVDRSKKFTSSDGTVFVPIFANGKKSPGRKVPKDTELEWCYNFLSGHGGVLRNDSESECDSDFDDDDSSPSTLP